MTNSTNSGMHAYVLALAALQTEDELEATGTERTQEDAFSQLNELIEQARAVTQPTPTAEKSDALSFYEPWDVGSLDGTRMPLIDAHGSEILLVLPTGEGDEGVRENLEDYAERTAACVNACAGIPTANLAGFSLLSFRESAMDVVRNWERGDLAGAVSSLHGEAESLGASN